MNYHNNNEQPGTSAGTDNRREELLGCFNPVKVFSDRTVRDLKRVEPRHQCLVCGYSCDLCNQKFSRKGHLTKHLLTHKDIRQFQCSECNYKAFTKQNLVIHLLQHSGAKPQKCDVCDYSTTTKSSLNGHKQTHRDDKPYSCTLYTYKAKQSAGLYNHMKKHTGYRFICSECDYQTSIQCSNPPPLFTKVK